MYKLLIITFLFLSFKSPGQNQLIEKLFKKLESKEVNIEVEVSLFPFSTIDDSYKEEEKIYRLQIATKNNQYKIEFSTLSNELNLDNYLIVCDGESEWRYNKNDNEVMIIDNDKNISALDFIGVLGDYQSEYTDRIIINGVALDVVNIFPENQSTLFFLEEKFDKIQFIIDSKNLDLKIIIVENTLTNIKYSCRVLKLSHDTDIRSFMFKVNDYPNIEVIDLR